MFIYKYNTYIYIHKWIPTYYYPSHIKFSWLTVCIQTCRQTDLQSGSMGCNSQPKIEIEWYLKRTWWLTPGLRPVDSCSVRITVIGISKSFPFSGHLLSWALMEVKCAPGARPKQCLEQEWALKHRKRSNIKGQFMPLYIKYWCLSL